jgi:phosphodiesterase/alkaline phosphatase D-like protein
METMKFKRRDLTKAAMLGVTSNLAAQVSQDSSTQLTHGPFLGHVGPTEVWIWGRTTRPAELRIRYGTSKDRLDQLSAPIHTSHEHDLTAWLHLTGLKSNQRYHYQFTAGGPIGTFHTVPVAADFAHPHTNPKGLFNFRFAFGSCSQQRFDPSLPAYKTMNRDHAHRLLFGIMNGDWLYEEKRDFPVAEWRKQTGCNESQTPALVNMAPALVGVWENYKFYLEQGAPLAEWHRNVPGYFTPDDHEIINDVYGTGSAGITSREAVFRDISLRAWYDYIAGSNPLATKQNMVFGRATLVGDTLTDNNADYSALNLAETTNLHIHWGTQLSGVVSNSQAGPGNPNAGVYSFQVLDRHRLRLSPKPKQDGSCAYSIGRHNYGKFRVGNVEVYLLDTRGMRDMHDIKNPAAPGLYMLGKAQHDWLKTSMQASDADFFFLASTVNLMVPHVGSPMSKDPIAGKDDAWTAFLAEREELIQFWDSLGKPVLVMTGDLHNSWAIKVTDRVWEFASGPHNSQNHPFTSEGGRPINGPFNSRGRQCDVRWSSFVMSDVPPRLRNNKVFAIAQINNVYQNPDAQGQTRWVAYPRPHVVIQYYDGITGDLLYAEPVHGK